MSVDINITVIDREGTEHKFSVPTDMNLNLMEIIKMYELAQEGTLGICGGMAMCASCQCYILNNPEIPEMQYDEDAMLSEAFHVQENSRLSCQIPITQQLNNLEVEIAPES